MLKTHGCEGRFVVRYSLIILDLVNERLEGFDLWMNLFLQTCFQNGNAVILLLRMLPAVIKQIILLKQQIPQTGISSEFSSVLKERAESKQVEEVQQQQNTCQHRVNVSENACEETKIKWGVVGVLSSLSTVPWLEVQSHYSFILHLLHTKCCMWKQYRSLSLLYHRTPEHPRSQWPLGHKSNTKEEVFVM